MRRKVDHRTLETTCSVEAVLEIIGGKWKGVILYHLIGHIRRFNELGRLMPGITQRMLTRQLRELEDDGIVDRHVYAQVPPKVEYRLTALGQTLTPIILAMREWGNAHLGASDLE